MNYAMTAQLIYDWQMINNNNNNNNNNNKLYLAMVININRAGFQTDFKLVKVLDWWNCLVFIYTNFHIDFVNDYIGQVYVKIGINIFVWE